MIRGTRGRIGFLWPADGLNDDEYWSYLPDGVALLTARYRVAGALSVTALEADADCAALIEAAGLLRLAHADVAALGDCAGLVVHGPDYERELSRAVQRELGRPAITMPHAIVNALRVLGARRIALLIPYGAEVGKRFVAFFDAYGIDVAHSLALDLAAETEIADLEPERWRELALSSQVAACGALVLGGGGIRAASILETLERDLGRPVVAGPAALIWAACRLLRVEAARPGLGCLFSKYAGVEREP